MKAWKWTALAVSGGVLLQFSACATDFAYYILQAAATQVAAGLITSAVGTS